MMPSNSKEPYTPLWQRKIEAPNQFGQGVRDGFDLSSKIVQGVAAIALIRYLGRK